MELIVFSFYVEYFLVEIELSDGFFGLMLRWVDLLIDSFVIDRLFVLGGGSFICGIIMFYVLFLKLF